MPRYPQMEAAHLIYERVSAGGQKGRIWHHQGSGKTLLMVLAASLLLADTRSESPTIISSCCFGSWGTGELGSFWGGCFRSASDQESLARRPRHQPSGAFERSSGRDAPCAGRRIVALPSPGQTVRYRGRRPDGGSCRGGGEPEGGRP
ncbi:DEAD/DEAH box helicase family protein [Streptomyces sp. NPDC101227]|uniref:DEAD/DEAH box helicase family protein n=1 Tax=Streptomyces sp. NPDC101227 TaxID=3366136 RepID=UPI0037F98A1B